MERSELVRKLVVNAMCDDYENVDQVILQDVERAGARFGLTIKRPEVVRTLAGLIADGMAKAYDLSVKEPGAIELEGMPSLDIIENGTSFKTYFYLTKKGMDFHLSDDAWLPFGDGDEPEADK